jgi:hypothetical protein
MNDRLRGILRLAASATLLLFLFQAFDAAEIGAHLVQLDLRWVLPALLPSVLQTMLVAWRWRFTAERLGFGMPYRQALGEYYGLRAAVPAGRPAGPAAPAPGPPGRRRLRLQAPQGRRQRSNRMSGPRAK